MIESDAVRLRRKLYMIWFHIKDRCYNPKNERYHLYGGKGVVMCEEWNEFKTFLSDVKEIKGYSDEDILDGKIHLDKDSVEQGNKIYSKEKCAFISIEMNNKFKPNQMKPFKAISPKGEEYTSFNQSEFAREQNLRQSTIADCLKGRVKKHKGWSFTFLNK